MSSGEVPEKPLLSVTDTEVPVTGKGDVYITVFGTPARAGFDFVQVATVPKAIREPVAAVLAP